MENTRIFTRKELEENLLPLRCSKWKILDKIFAEKTRWYTKFHVIFQTAESAIFQLPNQNENEAYRVDYFEAATEYQEQDFWAWEKEIKATVVHLVEKTIKAWEPI